MYETLVENSKAILYITQDAREAMRVVFFCTCKTYLYMYAQNEIFYEYIQILFLKIILNCMNLQFATQLNMMFNF